MNWRLLSAGRSWSSVFPRVFSHVCFPGVSITHNKKAVKQTPQKADASDYEKKRSRRRLSFNYNLAISNYRH